MKILVFNAGSSSLKFEVFDAQKRGRGFLKSLFHGHFDNHGRPIKDFDGEVKKAVRLLISKKIINGPSDISAIGHRVVHGGNFFSGPIKITAHALSKIESVAPLAPLHNPPNLAVIRACRKIFGKTPQVAVFDTGFFRTLPEKAYLYGLPYSLSEKFGIRRFGFHGISHEYVFEQTRKKLGEEKSRKVVTCHLGNGCSIAAIKDGKAIDVSMGFTPLEGVPMGTRSGDIDPSICFYLLKNGFGAEEIETILNKKSGLLGVSEISGDVRDLWAQYKRGNKRAKLTLEWFAYRIAKYIGSYAAALGGLDCLVFTGGIGENAFYLRKWIVSYLGKFLKFKVLVIKTDEELKIARETMKTMI